jgi:hypothetical protein
MPEIRPIRLSRLRLDPINPRLDDGQESQRQALSAMMESQGSKLIALARDIAKQGLSPIERFLVIEATNEIGDFIVLEGNRRLTSLKLLMNPDLAEPVLGKPAVKTLRVLASDLQYKADSVLDCAVVDSRDEAIHWLRLRHAVGLDGAGSERWGTPEQERFDVRNGRVSPEMKVLDFLTSRGALTQSQRESISITNLRRLLNDPAVREALGIEIDRKSGTVRTRFPAEEVVKPLTRVAKELAADTFKVGEIYTKDDRDQFIRRLRRADRPNPKTAAATATELTVASSVTAPKNSGAGGKKQGRPAKRRSRVAPPTLSLKIAHSRIKDIYRELQRLKVEDFANSGAILIRVFLELSVDHFLKVNKVAVKPGAELSIRLQSVHDHLLADGTMTKAELAPVRKAISSSDLISASVSTFNLYVHSLNLSPSPNDVRIAWDNLQLFFERLWPV